MYYVICSCPRSGSTLLAEALSAMGVGQPQEYLNPFDHTDSAVLARRKDFMSPTPEAYVERIRQEHTLNGIFGIKTDYLHLADFPALADRPEHFFPNAKYISITRRNIVRQALSATRAVQTKAWTARLPERKQPRFSYLAIIKHLAKIAQEIELWERFYTKHGIMPLRIVYEDLDEHYEETMKRVVSFLGISGDIPPAPTKKQSDALTEAWVERFIRAFRGKGRLSRIFRLSQPW